ncbi:hypothetical protein Ancab_028183 [Ancistrocladus abbreviatus]
MLAVEKQKRGTFWDKVRQSANYVSTLHGVAEKTKKINKTITNIYNNFQLYGINMNGVVKHNDPAYPYPKSSMAVQRRRTDVEKDMVGLKDEADNITKKLTTGMQELDFVLIIGVGKCMGLPLSIIAMADILVGEKSLDKWNRTMDDVNSILVEDQTSNEIRALSYHDLPREVIPCFLYFAAFPEDFEAPTRQLIRLWVAEGFVQKSREHNVNILQKTTWRTSLTTTWSKLKNSERIVVSKPARFTIC